MIELRIATSLDIPALCDLLSLLFTQEDEFMPNKTIQEHGLQMIIDNPLFGHILIATNENIAIGMVSVLYTVSTALGGMAGTIEDMIVHPKFRQAGIGSKLIEYSLKFAQEQDLKRLTLLTDKTNIKAHHFYIKHNFTKSSMIPFRKLI